MRTYRVFDCRYAVAQASDVVFYGPRWLAALLCWVKGLGGGCWDYQREDLYQRNYERAQVGGEG